MNEVNRTKQYFQRGYNLRGAAHFFDEVGAYYDAAKMEEQHQDMSFAHSLDPADDIGNLLDYNKPQEPVAKKNDLIGAIEASSPYRHSMRDG